MSKRGYSLIELLIIVGILGVLASVAIVNYNKYLLNAQKSNLHTSAKVFAASVKACVDASGGWEITHPSAGALTPCKITDKTKLKERLDFDCPEKATCNVRHHVLQEYYCLSIELETQGKKIQIFSRIPQDNPANYQILCNDNLSDYVKLSEGVACRKAQTGLKNKGFKNPCLW